LHNGALEGNHPCLGKGPIRRGKLKNTEKSTKNSKSTVYILRNIILIALIVIAAKFFFDEGPENDRIGWVLLVLFWTLKSLFDFYEDRKNGNKKSAVVNFLIATVGVCLFVWQMTSILPL
jgi:hypothetical protein